MGKHNFQTFSINKPSVDFRHHITKAVESEPITPNIRKHFPDTWIWFNNFGYGLTKYYFFIFFSV